MRVITIVSQVLEGLEGRIHRARLLGVLAAVVAIVQARTLSAAAIGRAVATKTDDKHGIKRIDRMLGNALLQRQWPEFFRAMAGWVLQQEQRPVVLVDWTHVTGRFNALYAAVAFEGRALTLYEEVHHERYLGNTFVQNRFLKRLAALLPEGCKPLIVSDAGFHGAFFRQVKALGWDFLGRIRGTAKARRADGVTYTKAQLYRRAQRQAKSLGVLSLYTSRQSVSARLVLVHRPRKAKRAATSCCGKDEREYRARARDPWLLATSLLTPSADAIVALYEKRMQIEQLFRDAKNHRFGWCLRHVRSKDKGRLTVLLMLAALATLAVILLGIAVHVQGQARRFQANTLCRRVLSFFSLGNACLSHPSKRPKFRLSQVRSYLRAAISASLPGAS